MTKNRAGTGTRMKAVALAVMVAAARAAGASSTAGPATEIEPLPSSEGQSPWIDLGKSYQEKRAQQNAGGMGRVKRDLDYAKGLASDVARGIHQRRIRCNDGWLTRSAVDNAVSGQPGRCGDTSERIRLAIVGAGFKPTRIYSIVVTKPRDPIAEAAEDAVGAEPGRFSSDPNVTHIVVASMLDDGSIVTFDLHSHGSERRDEMEARDTLTGGQDAFAEFEKSKWNGMPIAQWTATMKAKGYRRFAVNLESVDPDDILARVRTDTLIEEMEKRSRQGRQETVERDNPKPSSPERTQDDAARPEPPEEEPASYSESFKKDVKKQDETLTKRPTPDASDEAPAIDMASAKKKWERDNARNEVNRLERAVRETEGQINKLEADKKEPGIKDGAAIDKDMEIYGKSLEKYAKDLANAKNALDHIQDGADEMEDKKSESTGRAADARVTAQIGMNKSAQAENDLDADARQQDLDAAVGRTRANADSAAAEAKARREDSWTSWLQKMALEAGKGASEGFGNSVGAGIGSGVMENQINRKTGDHSDDQSVTQKTGSQDTGLSHKRSGGSTSSSGGKSGNSGGKKNKKEPDEPKESGSVLDAEIRDVTPDPGPSSTPSCSHSYVQGWDYYTLPDGSGGSRCTGYTCSKCGNHRDSM